MALWTDPGLPTHTRGDRACYEDVETVRLKQKLNNLPRADGDYSITEIEFMIREEPNASPP